MIVPILESSDPTIVLSYEVISLLRLNSDWERGEK
jgi:hypothetical protein